MLEGYNLVEQVVICSDVKPTECVFPYIELIRNDLKNKLISIDFLRKLIGIHNWKSQADAFANRISIHYPKQKNAHRKKNFFEKVVILPDNKASVIKLENNLKKYSSDCSQNNQ